MYTMTPHPATTLAASAALGVCSELAAAQSIGQGGAFAAGEEEPVSEYLPGEICIGTSDSASLSRSAIAFSNGSTESVRMSATPDAIVPSVTTPQPTVASDVETESPFDEGLFAISSADAKAEETGLALSVSNVVNGIECGGRIYANMDPLVVRQRIADRTEDVAMQFFTFTLPLAVLLSILVLPSAAPLAKEAKVWIVCVSAFLMCVWSCDLMSMEVDDGLVKKRFTPHFRKNVARSVEKLHETASKYVDLHSLPDDRSKSEQDVEKANDHYREFLEQFEALGSFTDEESGRIYDLRKLFGPKTLEPYVEYASFSLEGARFLPIIAKHSEIAGSPEFVSNIGVQWNRSDISPDSLDTVIWYLERENVSVMRWLMKWVAAGDEGAESILEEVRKRLDDELFVELVNAASYSASVKSDEGANEGASDGLPSYRSPGRLPELRVVQISARAPEGEPANKPPASSGEDVEVSAETGEDAEMSLG